MYAIWLLFEKNDNKYLSKIIKNLSEKYDAPQFLPHITTYGIVDAELTTIEKAVRGSINNLKPFVVNKLGEGYSDYFWETLFIEIKPNYELNLINTRLSDRLSRYTNYEFLPHISLVYKKMSSSEKKKIISNMNIKNEFTIASIAIQQFSENVGEWKIVKDFKL